MNRICLSLFLILSLSLVKGQDPEIPGDSTIIDSTVNYLPQWQGHPFYRDSLANDSFLMHQFPTQATYAPNWVKHREILGDPKPRHFPSNRWRFGVVLVLLSCVGIARLVSPGVILTYFRSFLKPKLLGEVLEDQNSEISGFSILMSFFTALIYALPLQWILWNNDRAMTDYPFGDYLLLGILIFSFIMLRFVLSSLVGRIFEARYFVTTAIYSSVFLNFFIAALALPAFLYMLLNDQVPDARITGIVIISLLAVTAFLKNIRALTHAASSFTYPTFYLILYLCALELGPWSWVYILLDY